MNDGLRALLPVIATCATIGVSCLAIVAVKSWRRWPSPTDWRSKIGVVPPR